MTISNRLRILASVGVFTLAFVSAGSAQQSGDHLPIRYHYPAGRQSTHHATPDTGLLEFNVTFHGGPVQTTTTSFAIYWKPNNIFMKQRYRRVVNQFLVPGERFVSA